MILPVKNSSPNNYVSPIRLLPEAKFLRIKTFLAGANSNLTKPVQNIVFKASIGQLLLYRMKISYILQRTCSFFLKYGVSYF